MSDDHGIITYTCTSLMYETDSSRQKSSEAKSPKGQHTSRAKVLGGTQSMIQVPSSIIMSAPKTEFRHT